MRVVIVAIVLAALAACSTEPLRPEPAPIPQPPTVPTISGSWTLTVESRMGTEDLDAIFEQSGEQLTGTVTSSRGEVPIEGTVQGDAVKFSMRLPVRGQALQLDYAGIVAGDTMSGTVQFGPIGRGTFSALRRAL